PPLPAAARAPAAGLGRCRCRLFRRFSLLGRLCLHSGLGGENAPAGSLGPLESLLQSSGARPVHLLLAFRELLLGPIDLLLQGSCLGFRHSGSPLVWGEALE